MRSKLLWMLLYACVIISVTVGSYKFMDNLIIREHDHGIVTLADRVDQVINSVVHVRHSSGWQGSGVIISRDGLVLTAQHVLSEAGIYTVTLNNGVVYKSTEACVSKNYDIGFIKLSTVYPLPYSRMGDFKGMRIGEQLFAIGSPFGDVNFNSVTLGILSAKFRSINDQRLPGWTVLFQSDVAANPGNSGCPIYNMQGEIVGIVVGGRAECVNYSVPVSCVKNLVEYAELLFALEQLDYVEREEQERDEYYDEWDEY